MPKPGLCKRRRPCGACSSRGVRICAACFTLAMGWSRPVRAPAKERQRFESGLSVGMSVHPTLQALRGVSVSLHPSRLCVCLCGLRFAARRPRHAAGMLQLFRPPSWRRLRAARQRPSSLSYACCVCVSRAHYLSAHRQPQGCAHPGLRPGRRPLVLASPATLVRGQAQLEDRL